MKYSVHNSDLWVINVIDLIYKLSERKLHNDLFETSTKDDGCSDHVEAILMTVALKIKNKRPVMHSLLRVKT